MNSTCGPPVALEAIHGCSFLFTSREGYAWVRSCGLALRCVALRYVALRCVALRYVDSRYDDLRYVAYAVLCCVVINLRLVDEMYELLMPYYGTGVDMALKWVFEEIHT